jgi:hypothetical protein
MTHDYEDCKGNKKKSLNLSYSGPEGSQKGYHEEFHIMGRFLSEIIVEKY